jgi:hypothetical protein
MTALLKQLTFTTWTKRGANPVMNRRDKLIKRLEDQKLLLSDPNHVRTIKKRVKNGEESTIVEKNKRVFPWWSLQPNGHVLFLVRNGWKMIEFDKGKSAIAVPALDQLPSVIDTVIAAVRNGELDEQLAQPQTSKKGTAPKARKAA